MLCCSGHLVEARAAGGDAHLVHSLAEFLIGASEGTYYGSSYSPGWGCDDGWLDAMNTSSMQHRLFNKALGPPLGLATNVSGVYRRGFASGTKVFVNHSDQVTHGGQGWSACIWWSDGEVSSWSGTKAAGTGVGCAEQPPPAAAAVGGG